MSIERNETIRFHEQGTLDAVTRWIAAHHDGIAEWFKNVRRQYQVDRANVPDEERVAALLLRDEGPQACAHWRAGCRRGNAGGCYGVEYVAGSSCLSAWESTG